MYVMKNSWSGKKKKQTRRSHIRQSNEDSFFCHGWNFSLSLFILFGIIMREWQPQILLRLHWCRICTATNSFLSVFAWGSVWESYFIKSEYREKERECVLVCDKGKWGDEFIHSMILTIFYLILWQTRLPIIDS